MNLWSHRFSQNTNEKLSGFLPYTLQGRNNSEIYWPLVRKKFKINILIFHFPHDFWPHYVIALHIFFRGFLVRKTREKKSRQFVACTDFDWKSFFFNALAHKSEARKVCKVNQEIYKINDLVAKGAKGSIWAKTTFKRPPCLFYALTLIEKIFVKTYKKRVLAKTICNINAQ